MSPETRYGNILSYLEPSYFTQLLQGQVDSCSVYLKIER